MLTIRYIAIAVFINGYYLVLGVLKKNYTKLYHCLPQDYMMTINKLKQLLRLPDDVLSELTSLPTVNVINEAIIGYLITAIKSDMDALQFCDVMENIVNSKAHIEILRNGNSPKI